MSRNSRENREKKKQQKQNKRKRQKDNLKKLQRGETVTITMRAKMPKPNEYKSIFDPKVIEDKIKILNNLDLRVVNDSEIISAVSEVISFQPQPGIRITSMCVGTRNIKGNYLYRVRACNGNCVASMAKHGDAWNPPPHVITRKGRLNSENESLLYVAENIETAIKEVKVKEEECFWLTVYNIENEISTVNIGDRTFFEQDDYYPIHVKIADFLRNEFTRDVKPGKEYEYRISNLISKFFYPIRELDGWSYPSVAYFGQYSLCLDPIKAKEKLSVAFVMHCAMQNNEVTCDEVAFLNEEGNFEHVTVDEALTRDERLREYFKA
ncbi:RES domain-containing protein [Bacillus cereus group sp. MYBK110-2]|uniref:RES domain-containing protein n=1 Tax=Bacillus cereus group TaxID=86661 RepID=UPI00094560E0|nr:RES domain-containing protein [Bacillus paranthracis]MBD0728253.1 hypothetical protein [Bacillus cereus]MCU4738984.1 RES domain-containing protein [Bacillus paranthracis]MCU4869130.1 RES domain-containing protein [Bacillus paranthracis]MCU5075052.1 RES domain-containing protein [Bacillus paranthracis]BCC60834.1 hypothetical protein BCJMU10_4142 [Bacillus cereus]